MIDLDGNRVFLIFVLSFRKEILVILFFLIFFISENLI